MECGDRKASKKVMIAILALLLAVIAVLLWLLLRPVPEPERIPTGNVDVFDIRIGCICKGEDGEECDDEDEDGFKPDMTPGANGSSSYSGGKINGKTDTDVDDEGVVYVDDKNGWYIYQKNLRIFENAAFEYTNKIAPGVSNSYNFKVHNETKNSIKYFIEFDEDSEYAINMMYRLRRGGTYIAGGESTWVDANGLRMAALKQLASDEVDEYILDWKWPYEDGKDAQDTIAGKSMMSEYSLGIKVNFEEI